ncbi:MAG: 3-isopropylmalate dehydratase small subunit [Proteobacteria bacterium]|nr:3-isopropylmalate dehydratase small subunit [Pseudomonadota bacterium]
MANQANDRRILRVAGRGLALRGDDIDTDQILPARFLTAVTFRGMEAHVFADARAAAAAAGAVHPLDDPRSAGARLLVVNRNFGCGSSREHAPQGLHRSGIAAIIGESFGEIFAGNCVAVGMPCVQADAETIAALQDLLGTAPQTVLSLDLEQRTLTAGDRVFPVSLAAGRQRQFVDGTWDPTAVLLAAGPAIEQTLAEVQAFQG